jgi:hypothetical protein
MPIGQNRDARIPTIPFNEPVLLAGRYAGNGAAVPNAVAGTTKSGLTLTYANTGNMTVTIPTPTGVFQSICMWVNQNLTSNSQVQKVVQFAPPANNASSIPIRIATVSANANTDVAVGEELEVEIWLSNSANP